MINLQTGVAGFYKLQTVSASGLIREDTGWFPNLITDSGMDYLANTDRWLTRCYVGTSSATPDVTDTSIGSLLASSTTVVGGMSSYGKQISTDPFYSYKIVAYEFSEGSATGNISEVAIGPSSGNVFSRSLVKDGSGNPTTVTVLSDEILRVVYEVRLYIPKDDVTGTVDVNGTSHSWTSRAMSISDNSYWNTSIFSSTGTQLEPRTDTSGNWSATMYGGAIGIVTSRPSGTSQRFSGASSVDPYVDGSFETSATYIASPDDDSVTEIGAMTYMSDFTAYQIGFTPKIPKSDTERFTIKVKHSWARRP